MIEQSATIIEATPHHLLLRPEQGGCHSCSQQGCGVSNLSALFGKRERLLKINNPGGFIKGQQVDVLLKESTYIRLVLLQYLLPLIAMIIVAAIAASISSMLLFQAFSVVVGLVAGMMISRHYLQKTRSRLGPDFIQIRHSGQMDNYPASSLQVKP
jgi:positive regulator of sigma E activity